MKQLILILSFAFFNINFLSAQWELLESNTVEQLTTELGLPSFVVEYDIDSYRVEYPTTNIDGTPGMASGLITIPRSADLKFPLMILQHGTVGSRDDVPSQLAGGYQLGQIFGTLGFVVIQADFLGLGINPGIHPYVHADSEAWVALDMMEHVIENYETNAPNRFLNDQIFISGYSQGGHAGMAVHRVLELEHADEYTVTAASHMSGPYSISEKMIDFTLGDEEYGFSAYLVSTSLSMKAAYPDLLADFEVEDIFKEAYLDDITAYANEDIDLWELNLAIENQLMADVGAIIPKEMINPEIVEALKNDPSHPMSMALADNDVFDWAPNAPTRLMYCSGDDQVTFENAILASEVMNANGANNVLALEHGATLDHGGCVTPATTASIFFFLNFRTLPTSTDDLFGSTLTQMSAVQIQNQLQVSIDPAYLKANQVDFMLTDMYGRTLLREELVNDVSLINLNNINSGMYFMTLLAEDQFQESQKVFIE